VDTDRLELCSNSLQVTIEHCYTDYRKAFSEIEADAVFIAVISPLHYDICKCALENDLHVYIEKPYTVSLEEAKELTTLAQSRNLKLMVNQNYRYFPTVMTLKNVIDRKLLGEPMFVHAQFYYFHEGKPYQRQMDNYMLMEMAVHHIDIEALM
jgi:predicted dehydrogenase